MTKIPPTYQGTSTLLMGGPGGGKTYSLATFLQAGLKLAIVFTEPRGPESIIAACQANNIPMDNLHWAYVSPQAPSFETMRKNAELIGSMSYAALTDLKSGLNKNQYTQFVTLLDTLANFKCQRTGEEFGPVDEFDNTWAFVLDSLSGLNLMAMDLVVGAKPVKHQGEWGVAMDNEERLIQKLCSDTTCFFVLTAHLEREMNEVTGSLNLSAGALGRKLAPKLPRFFSDVVHAYREGDNYYWSTATDNMDLKGRNLPIAEKLRPDFEQIIDVWKERALEAHKGKAA